MPAREPHVTRRLEERHSSRFCRNDIFVDVCPAYCDFLKQILVLKMKNAVVLLSGGLDSATVLAMARAQGFTCYTLSVDYGQRHRAELAAAQRVASALGAHEHRVINIDLTGFGGSALTDNSIAVPQQPSQGIPLTYVPARNTIMLSLALAYAEVSQAQHIFIGVNAVDYSGYPDCRPAYIEAFERMANLATRAAIEGRPLTIHAPLQYLSKAEIVRQGSVLGVDYGQTVSCYQADELGHACGACDSCRLRSAGFIAAGLPDPTVYRKHGV
jgi:7-cyano-7-deazaguanine synthase